MSAPDERAPRTRENHSTDVRIRTSRIDRVRELGDDAIVERVQLVRAVDGNRRDSIGNAVEDRFVGHDTKLQG